VLKVENLVAFFYFQAANNTKRRNFSSTCRHADAAAY
jgi:hypothetical protein